MYAALKTPKSGRNITITPKSPTKTAIQLRLPTFSPISNTDSDVISNGAIKKIAVVSASGIVTNAEKKTKVSDHYPKSSYKMKTYPLAK